MDHFFDFDTVKAEKAIAMRRYHRLQKLRNLFRAAELLSAVILLSWFSARLPFVLRISGDYLRRLSAVLVSPRFVFLLGNAIVLTLFAKSGHLNSSSEAAGAGDLYSEFINRQKPSPPSPAAAPEEIVYHDKGVCEESVSPVPDQRRPYRRSLSERAADNVKESWKDLRRSETDIGRKAAAAKREEEEEAVVAAAPAGMEKEEVGKEVKVRRGRVMNTTKHLWSGAVAAMVSRTFVAPLERLKLEYILRGSKKNLFELIKSIAVSQGLKGFWKGNFVNILRTAPFKAINFYAYDTYRKQLLKMSGNEETTNSERFIAGAAAGITATILCLPLDTIRTKMVAPGGEALGGVIGVFQHMVKTEGFFSLYKGLGPSIISMAPSGAVFYGVYDILKSSYLHSPEGMKRMMNQQGEDLNAFDQLELGPMRTLLYGAIAGACAEAATYPFEVVRRQLQLQVQATRLNAFATCLKIVEQGGVPALYAGLIPSLLQVLPSASISYFVYEFMKIVLKVE